MISSYHRGSHLTHRVKCVSTKRGRGSFSRVHFMGYSLFAVWVTIWVNQKSKRIGIIFSRQRKRKVPDFLRNQELFGGDYWTRTSDLLRVKIHLDVKGLLLGAFRYFLLHFFRASKRSLSAVSTRCYPDIGQRIGQVPGSAYWTEPGTLFTRGSFAAVIVVCNQGNVKCCFWLRQFVVYRSYRTKW